MKIYVLDSKGRDFVLENLSDSTQVKDLKKELIKQKQILYGIDLIFDGQILEDENTLGDYDLKNEHKIIYLGEFLGGVNILKKNNFYLF